MIVANRTGRKLMGFYRGWAGHILSGIILAVVALSQPAFCADSNVPAHGHTDAAKAMCPGAYLNFFPLDFSPIRHLEGAVEFAADKTPAKPVPGAEITVMCNDGRVAARVETDAEGHYSVPGMQFSVVYECILDPRKSGYPLGETRCVTKDYLDWRISVGINPRVAVFCAGCSTAPSRWSGWYTTGDPRGGTLYGGVAYGAGGVPLTPFPNARIEVRSADGKLVGESRSDLHGLYEVHDVKGSGPYTCTLYTGDAAYPGGLVSCGRGSVSWFLWR